MRNQIRRGLTLVEILIVLVVLGILTAIVVISFTRPVVIKTDTGYSVKVDGTIYGENDFIDVSSTQGVKGSFQSGKYRIEKIEPAGSGAKIGFYSFSTGAMFELELEEFARQNRFARIEHIPPGSPNYDELNIKFTRPLSTPQP